MRGTDSSLRNKSERIASDVRGGIAITLAVFLPVLLAIVGVAADYAYMVMIRTNLQKAAEIVLNDFRSGVRIVTPCCILLNPYGSAPSASSAAEFWPSESKIRSAGRRPILGTRWLTFSPRE